MKLFSSKILTKVIGVTVLLFPISGFACTAFINKIANGNGDGVILTKNRDSSIGTGYIRQEDMSSWTQDLRMFKPTDDKYRYVALMYSQESSGGERCFISSGINETGLSVTYNYDFAQKTAIKDTIGSIVQAESDTSKKILEEASTIEKAEEIIEKLKKEKKLPPMFVAVSDKSRYFIAEIAATNLQDDPQSIEDLKLEIKYKKSRDNSKRALIIANHFDSSSLKKYNYDDIENSECRFDQVEKLMKEAKHKNQYSQAIAIMCAKNHFYGETINSVNRESTKALYLTESYKNDKKPSKLFLELTSPAQMYNRAEIELNDKFWNRYSDNEAVVAFDKRYIPPVESIAFGSINDMVY